MRGAGKKLSYWLEEIMHMRQAVEQWRMVRAGDFEGLTPHIQSHDPGVMFRSHP